MPVFTSETLWSPGCPGCLLCWSWAWLPQAPGHQCHHLGLSPARGNSAFGNHSQLIPVALQHPQSSGKGLQVQELLSGLCWLSAVGFGAVISCWELCLHHQPCSFAFQPAHEQLPELSALEHQNCSFPFVVTQERSPWDTWREERAEPGVTQAQVHHES